MSSIHRTLISCTIVGLTFHLNTLLIPHSTWNIVKHEVCPVLHSLDHECLPGIHNVLGKLNHLAELCDMPTKKYRQLPTKKYRQPYGIWWRQKGSKTIQKAFGGAQRVAPKNSQEWKSHKTSGNSISTLLSWTKLDKCPSGSVLCVAVRIPPHFLHGFSTAFGQVAPCLTCQWTPPKPLRVAPPGSMRGLWIDLVPACLSAWCLAWPDGQMYPNVQ